VSSRTGQCVWGTFRVKVTAGWDERLSVEATGRGMVTHAGAVLPRVCADRLGLTAALTRVLPSGGGGAGWRDRGQVLTGLAVAITLGATNLSGAEQLMAHQAAVFKAPASDSTGHRMLASISDAVLERIARERAKVRRHVWRQIAARPAGFPWITVAGKELQGWIVIDLDATLITAHSAKEGAAATFKKGFGFHPLGCWCANTDESLAMLLREGNAGSNTVADHITVLAAALAQIPDSSHAKILVRIDGAGATHQLLEYIEALNTTRRTVRYTVGWTITDADEQAIALLPESAWEDSLHQDGEVHDQAQVAELTGLSTRTGWAGNLRLIARRTLPSRRHAKKLTDFEKKTGWRYGITATSINRMHAVPGSHQPQWLDAVHRSHAVVEDRVKTGKNLGLRNLPSKSWTVNRGWVLAANLANDLNAWTRLLGLYDQPGLARATPETLRYRLWHIPARLVRHARRRRLKISRDWPWRHAFTLCWQRLTKLTAPT
jgi:hypothetical protein